MNDAYQSAPAIGPLQDVLGYLTEIIRLDGREVERLPQALRKFYELGLTEVVHVSELLEIPTVVATTDLLGIFPSSMGPLVEKQLGLRILEVPLELPPLPIYMVWHKARRNDAAHHWLRELVTGELGGIANE